MQHEHKTRTVETDIPNNSGSEPRWQPYYEGIPAEADKKKLGQWYATAICGNDITSSCLYVAALCTVHAGCLAPIALLIVAIVLYMYRKGFLQFRFGYAAALPWMSFVIIMALTLLIFRSSSAWVYYEGEVRK